MRKRGKATPEFLTLTITNKGLVVSPMTNKDSLRMMRAHKRQVVNRYGKARWNRANVGWVEGENKDKDGAYEFICTKVYGDPCMIVETKMYKKTKKLVHLHEEYGR